MSLNEEKMQLHENGTNERNSCGYIDDQNLDTSQTLECSTDKDVGSILCRVCHCSESDRRGDAALGFLNISPPSVPEINMGEDSTDKLPRKSTINGAINNKISQEDSEFVQFVSPEGDIFICSTDIESGSYLHQDKLIDLGCSCKNDLAYAHYACALKWFISHGSTICEICRSAAKNVRAEDFRKVVSSLKVYEELRNRTVNGEPACLHMGTNSGIDPDAVAAIRRQRLSEVSLWFSPRNNSATISQETIEELPYNPTDIVATMETQTTKTDLERTGILVATGLITIILLWYIAPRVGKKAAKFGFHILLGGVCALAVVIFLRVVARSRFKYGPVRYWDILFVFWFLSFAVWASRTHNIHTT